MTRYLAGRGNFTINEVNCLLMKHFIRNTIFHYSSMITVAYDLERFPPGKQVACNEIDGGRFIARQIHMLDPVMENELEKAVARMDFSPPFTLEEARMRLAGGHYFSVVENENQIIGWSWAGVGKVFFGEFNCMVELKQRHAFSFNTYIDKEFRGKGLNQLVLNQQLLCLKKDGFKKVWALIHVYNKASLRSYLKNGWLEIGRYRFLRICFLDFKFPPEGI